MPHKDPERKKLYMKEYFKRQKELGKVRPKRDRKEYNAIYYEANKDKLKKDTLTYYYDNKEKISKSKKTYAAKYRKEKAEIISAKSKEYAQRNKDKIRKYQKAYREKNRGLIRYYVRAYQTKKKHCSPVWLSSSHKWMMKEIYALAVLRTELTGVEWHVDHIVPLRGEIVSGLHVPWNLQVLPYIDNIRKGNKFTAN
jgi:hypothetical protein